jgi:N-acetylated-alpha-linked acidic dipeptidase
VLPYDFIDFADTIHKYTDELKILLKTNQEEIQDRNQNLQDGAFNAVSDPRRPMVTPPKEEEPPFINFAPLDNAQGALDRSAERYSRAMKAFASENTTVSPQVLSALNEKLAQAERSLTNPEGLPRHPWYRHLIYAPRFLHRTAPKTLPGVREGIEKKVYRSGEGDHQWHALLNYVAAWRGPGGIWRKRCSKSLGTPNEEDVYDLILG